MYTYIPAFLDFLPISVTRERWVESPVLYSNFVAFKYKASSICFLHLSLVLPKAEPEMSLWVQVAYLEVISGGNSEGVGE